MINIFIDAQIHLHSLRDAPFRVVIDCRRGGQIPLHRAFHEIRAPHEVKNSKVSKNTFFEQAIINMNYFLIVRSMIVFVYVYVLLLVLSPLSASVKATEMPECSIVYLLTVIIQQFETITDLCQLYS
jgi:hypothetical protein